MSNKNLDNFFQQKANQRSFEFEDDYWKEMELLLEDEDDKKTPLPFWWQNGRLLLGSLIAIIAIGALYFSLKQKPNESNSVNSNTKIQNQNNSNSNSDNLNSSNKNTTSFNSNTTQDLNVENSKNTSITDLNSNDFNNSNTSEKSSKNKSDRQPQLDNSTAVSSNQRNSPNRSRSIPNNVVSLNDNTNPTGLASQNKTDNNNKTTSTNTSSPPFDLFSNRDNVGSQGNSWIKHRPDGTLYSDYEKTLSEETKFNFLDLIDLSKIDEGLFGSLKTKLPKLDSPEQNEKNYDLIAIGANIGLSRYLKDLDLQSQQPYSPAPGIYATFPLSKKLSLATGLNYWARGNLNASLSEDSTVYNFGFQRIKTTHFVDKAIYLEVPVSLKYRIKEKHIAEIGGNFSYLITAQGQRSTTISSDFGSVTETTNSTNTYKNWLNSYDIALRLGYHYQWHDRSTIGLQWQYGLTDTTPNDIFNQNIFDRNHQFRIRLGYDLIYVQTNKK